MCFILTVAQKFHLSLINKPPAFKHSSEAAPKENVE